MKNTRTTKSKKKTKKQPPQQMSIVLSKLRFRMILKAMPYHISCLGAKALHLSECQHPIQTQC